MSTESKETLHLNEGLSKGEYCDNLDEQKLEAVAGGVDPRIMKVYLNDQLKLARTTLQERRAIKANLLDSSASRPKLQRSISAPPVPNFHEYRNTSISK
jgi:hypothetical protein